MKPGDVVHTVERRTHGAQRWRDVTADVLGWDGVTLVVRTVPDAMLIRGGAWRIDGVVFEQRRVDTAGPVRVTLVRSAASMSDKQSDRVDQAVEYVRNCAYLTRADLLIFADDFRVPFKTLVCRLEDEHIIPYGTYRDIMHRVRTVTILRDFVHKREGVK